MSVHSLPAVDVAQARALVAALDGVEAHAAVTLKFLAGALYVRVDPDDRDQPSWWLAVDEDAAVSRTTAPPVALQMADLELRRERGR